MNIELAFTPSGHVTAVARADEAPDASGGSSGVVPRGGVCKLVKAFASGQAEGFFALATERFDAPLGPSPAYWRDFAGRYLTELCHTPKTRAPIWPRFRRRKPRSWPACI